MQSRTGRWAPHEVATIAAFVLLPLGADAEGIPSWLLGDTVKAGLLALAGYFLALNFIGTARPSGLTPSVRAIARPLLAYVAVVTVATVSWMPPTNRLALLAGYLIGATAAFLLCERSRPGSWLDITYRVAIVHMLLTATLGEREQLFGETERLVSSLSAVTVGFEAVAALGVALYRLRRTSPPLTRLSALLVAGLSVYVAYATYSRAALISLAVALVVAWIARGRVSGNRAARLVALSVAGAFLLARYSEEVLTALGGRDRYGISNLTGRTQIWSTVVANNEHWLRGYGFPALRFPDGAGPDRMLMVATRGLPVENALLYAVVTGGIVAGLLWLWLAVSLGRALWVSGHPLARYLLIALGVNAVLSIGAAGNPPVFSWLLGSVSLLAVVSRSDTQARERRLRERAASGDRSPRGGRVGRSDLPVLERGGPRRA